MATQSCLNTRDDHLAISATVLLFLTVAWPVTAQPTTTATPDDTPVLLSPFVVSAQEDRGYAATTTLAGGRIRTPIEDVGASISIVTEQFFSDTNSTNLRDVLVYTAGTEVAGVGGNFGDARVSTFQAADTATSNDSGTRLRGLAAADITRAYFRTVVPFDNYNAGRLEINRGANAILFGVGSPAGIINFSPVTADPARAFGSAELEFGRFESNRFSLDFNQPLVVRQAAVRVAAVRDHGKFQQDPAFNRDTRLFATATVTPDFLRAGILSGSTLRVGVESGEIEANNPRSLPPQDRVSLWFDPTERMRQSGIRPMVTHNVSLPFSASNGLTVAQNLTRSPIVIFPDHMSSVPGAPNPPGPEIIGRQWIVSNSTVAGGTSVYLAPGRLEDSLRRAGDPDAAFYVTPTVTDPSIFDFRNQLLDGDNKREISEFDTLNLSLEQLFFGNKAGLEFAYDRQERTNLNRSLLERGRTLVTIDVNTNLLDASPNPNFSRPYTHFRPEASFSFEEVETSRLTGFGELDFADRFDSHWGRWLGRHVATVLYQEEETFGENRAGTPFYLADPFPYANNQNRFNDAGKSIEVVSYLGPAVTDAPGANIPSIGSNRLNIAELTAGGLFALRRQSAGSSVEYVPLNILTAADDLADNASSALQTRRIIESRAFNLQSYFFTGMLVGNVGWREETVDSYRVNAPVATDGSGARLVSSPAYRLPTTPDQTVEETLFSWNLVTKTPRSWLEHLPFVSGLSFHYNESENFSPPTAARLTPFGELRPPPLGSTRDYGFTVALLNDRLVAKANWYETKQSGINESTATASINAVVSNHLLAFNATRDGIATDAGNGFPAGYVAPPAELLQLYNVQINNGTISTTNPGVVGTTDFVAKGLEIELIANLTDQWTLALNVARQESVRSNTGGDAIRLLYETPVANAAGIVPAWLATGEDVPLFIGATPGGSGTLADWTRRFIVNPLNSVRLQDNGPAQELRKWRWNTVTNYRFTEGRLQGFNVGGAARWQDRVAIGFPLTNSEDGSRIIDVSNPYFGPAEINFDAWVGYERRLWNDRVVWKIQLNIRNVLAEEDLIPVFANPDGSQAVFRIPESRTWTLSSKFSF